MGNHSVQATVSACVAGCVATRIAARVAATRSWADLYRNLLGNTAWYSNTDLVRYSFANSLAFLDAFGFHYFAANRVRNFAGFGFTDPFGRANRNLFGSGFAYVTSATAIDRSLLLLANPFCATVVDDSLLLFTNPFCAAVVNRFGARFANRSAYRVRTLDAVLFTAVLGAANLFGFTRWNPYFATHGATWSLATYLVAATRNPFSATGARIVRPATRNVDPFCIGASRYRFFTRFPVPTANLNGSGFGVRNATGTCNGTRFLFLHVSTNVISHLSLLDFLDRTANRVINGPLFHFLDRATNGVIDGFCVVFGDGASHRIATRFVSRFPNRTSDRVCFVTVASLTNGSTDGYLNGFPYCPVTITITCFFTRVVNNASARTHDCVATASCVFSDCVGCSRIK